MELLSSETRQLVSDILSLIELRNVVVSGLFVDLGRQLSNQDAFHHVRAILVGYYLLLGSCNLPGISQGGLQLLGSLQAVLLLPQLVVVLDESISGWLWVRVVKSSALAVLNHVIEDLIELI